MREFITVNNHLVKGEIFKEKEYENIMIIIDEHNRRHVVRKHEKRKIDRSKKLRNDNLMAKIKVHFPNGTFTIYENAHEAAKDLGITPSSVYYNARMKRVTQKGKSKGLRFEKMR